MKPYAFFGNVSTGIAGTVHAFSTDELLARAARMHHGDKGHTLLKHYAALKGLTTSSAVCHPSQNTTGA